MSIRERPALREVRRRRTVDQDLTHLFAEIAAARDADRVSRAGGLRDDAFRSNSGRLVSSLGAYARALDGYRLPVPCAIRDELRLRLGLS